MTRSTPQTKRRRPAQSRSERAAEIRTPAIAAKVAKTRETVHVTPGALPQTDVIRENIGILEQYQTAIRGYQLVLPRLQAEGIIPTDQDIDAIIESLGEESNPLGPGTQGPLTRDQERQMIDAQLGELDAP